MDPNSDEANLARARLEEERARLEKSIRALGEEYDQGGAISKGGDAARDTAFAESNMELRGELEASLNEVEAALQRIEDGTYGIDEETGEPIDPARLEAIPTARTNI